MSRAGSSIRIKNPWLLPLKDFYLGAIDASAVSSIIATGGGYLNPKTLLLEIFPKEMVCDAGMAHRACSYSGPCYHHLVHADNSHRELKQWKNCGNSGKIIISQVG